MTVKQLFIVATDAEDGKTVVKLSDGAGGQYELKMPSMECQSLIEMLKLSLAEALRQPQAESGSALSFEKLQLEQAGETLFVRLFLTDKVFHEYQIPIDTNVANDLMVALELGQKRNEAKITVSGTGSMN